MIKLNSKQIKDLSFLSDIHGGKPLEIETVAMKGMSGYRVCAYINMGRGEIKAWHLPKQAAMRYIGEV